MLPDKVPKRFLVDKLTPNLLCVFALHTLIILDALTQETDTGHILSMRIVSP